MSFIAVNEHYAAAMWLDRLRNWSVGDFANRDMAQAKLMATQDVLEEFLKKPEIRTCRRAGRILVEAVADAIEALQGDRQYFIPDIRAHAISSRAGEFMTLLFATLEALPTFVADGGGALPDARLATEAEQTFEQTALELLPPGAIVDINQAGRALSFELGTAAGFHTARALEAAVEAFLVCTVETRQPYDELAESRRNLGSFCNVLARALVGQTYPWSSGQISGRAARAEELVACLFMIKNLFRNPLAHAREFNMTMSEALRFFNLSHQAIEALATERTRRAWSTSMPKSPKRPKRSRKA